MSVSLESFPAGGLAVVLGASGGIGAALQAGLQDSGAFAQVMGLSRRADGFELTDEASIARAAAQVQATGLPVRLVIVATGLLHNGAIKPEKTWRQLDAAALAKSFAINATGPALVAKHFLPLLPRDRRAVFAALSARVGSIGDNRLGGWHSYRASKAALNMMLRNLAIELGRTHRQAIVAGLHPGMVDTGLSEPFQKGVSENKLFTPDYSAERMLSVLEGLEPHDSGGVFAWDGKRVPE